MMVHANTEQDQPAIGHPSTVLARAWLRWADEAECDQRLEVAAILRTCAVQLMAIEGGCK